MFEIVLGGALHVNNVSILQIDRKCGAIVLVNKMKFSSRSDKGSCSFIHFGMRLLRKLGRRAQRRWQ